MRKRLGVILVEDENGGIGVQLFENPDTLAESFKCLNGEKRQRATMLRLEYGEKLEVSGETKELPVPEVPAEERPDGWALGQGPVTFPKSDKEHLKKK